MNICVWVKNPGAECIRTVVSCAPIYNDDPILHGIVSHSYSLFNAMIMGVSYDKYLRPFSCAIFIRPHQAYSDAKERKDSQHS